MGSKTPEGYHQTPNGPNSANCKAANPDTGSSRRGSSAADLDRGIVSEDDDDDDDADGQPGVTAHLTPTPTKDKKKKRKSSRKRNSRKTAAAGEKTSAVPLLKQTKPPRVLLSNLFPDKYPVGELVQYETTCRTTDEETRYNSRYWDEGFLQDYRQAAEIHRQVRSYAQQELIKPGATLLSIAEGIEDGVRALTGHQGLETGDALKAGLGFPTGLCLNNIAAHWTPNPGGKDVVLQSTDVLKVDFGVHVNGRIVDSAFTVAHDPVYYNLLAAVKDATNTGIKHAGVDARISEISAAIQEAMESYEVELNGKLLPVKAVRSLCGHDILRYQIHGRKQIPFVRNHNRDKMEEGEVFAIETFGTTGKASLRDDSGVYGYGRNSNASTAGLRLPSARSLLKTIDANFGTLVFCRRYLERLGVKSYHLGMKSLIDQGIMDVHAPLVDVAGSYVAQFEHTILLHSGGKEVVSRGDDY